VAELARRGWSVEGFDLSEPMLDFARQRLARRRLPARLANRRLEAPGYPRRFDLAHCLVSTFKYVLDEGGARSHLQGVADALRPGGIYVLGFHLSEYASQSRLRERWVVERRGTRVVCNIQSWPPDRRRRLERVRSRLVVHERGRELRSESEWLFRTYDARQVKRLLRTVPELELVAVHDFVYDMNWTRELDDEQLDCLCILRRRAD
jgi:SAM-dependent methyltransferase